MPTKKTVQLYENGIEASGTHITVGHLRALMERCKEMGDETPIICSADEEGNRFGSLYSVIYEDGSQEVAQSLGLYRGELEQAVTKHGALVLMPAI